MSYLAIVVLGCIYFLFIAPMLVDLLSEDAWNKGYLWQIKTGFINTLVICAIGFFVLLVLVIGDWALSVLIQE